MGRTARAGGTGRALLFLLSSELGFLRHLKHSKVPLNEYTFPVSKIANVQGQLEKLIEKNYYLNQSARDGYRSYLQSYASHSHKEIFDVNALDLVKVAKAFGFQVPPKVNINIALTLKDSSASKRKRYVTHLITKIFQRPNDAAGYRKTTKLNSRQEHYTNSRKTIQEEADTRQWSR